MNINHIVLDKKDFQGPFAIMMTGLQFQMKLFSAMASKPETVNHISKDEYHNAYQAKKTFNRIKKAKKLFYESDNSDKSSFLLTVQDSDLVLSSLNDLTQAVQDGRIHVHGLINNNVLALITSCEFSVLRTMYWALPDNKSNRELLSHLIKGCNLPPSVVQAIFKKNLDDL